jgi:hypothetical protein
MIKYYNSAYYKKKIPGVSGSGDEYQGSVVIRPPRPQLSESPSG